MTSIYIAESPKKRILKFVLLAHTRCCDVVELPEDAQPLLLRFHPGKTLHPGGRVDVYYTTRDMGAQPDLPKAWFEFVFLLTGDEVGDNMTFIDYCGGGPYAVIHGFFRKKGPA